jgi:hypothetical protein
MRWHGNWATPSGSFAGVCDPIQHQQYHYVCARATSLPVVFGYVWHTQKFKWQHSIHTSNKLRGAQIKFYEIIPNIG